MLGKPEGRATCGQGAMIKDIREISRERLERTFMTNIVGMISLIQVMPLCLLVFVALL